MKETELIGRPEWDEHIFVVQPEPGDESPVYCQSPLWGSLSDQAKQSVPIGMALKEFPRLPDKWDQPEPNSLHIGVVAFHL